MQVLYRNRCRISFLVAIACWLGANASLWAADYVPGQTYFGHEKFVEYHAGDLPLVFAAPHGGREKPDLLPDRTKGTFSFDVGTQELARAVASEFHKRTGRHVHLVICRVQRLKLDCNREIVEAAAGNKHAEQAWKDYHQFLQVAGEAAEKKEGRGFFIDLHGHGHELQRLELGYLHDAKHFHRSDAEIDKSTMAADGSLRAIVAKKHIAYSQLMRGPSSLGALMEKHGFPSSPSPTMPRPEEPFFNGGYTVREYVRLHPASAGLQIESNYTGVRDDAASRAKFAKALADSLETYLELHGGPRWMHKPSGVPQNVPSK